MTKWYRREDRGASRNDLSGCVIWLLLAAVLLAMLAVGHRLWLPLVARWLIVDQAPTAASAIVVLGGGDGSRCNRASALYGDELAPTVIATGERIRLPGITRTRAELSADLLVAGGVPRGVILLLNEAISTRDEAVQTRALAEARGFDSLIVVTDGFHTRRTSLAFRHAYRGSGIDLVFVASYPEWLDVQSWWLAERPFLAVVQEYIKLLYYLLNGYI